MLAGVMGEPGFSPIIYYQYGETQTQCLTVCVSFLLNTMHDLLHRNEVIWNNDENLVNGEIVHYVQMFYVH